MLKGRAPFDAEVDDEVLKEFKGREAEKKKSRPNHKKDIAEVRAHVAELEKSVTILGENVTSSQKCLEEMMHQISESKWKARKLIQGQNRGIGSGGSGG